MQWVNVMGTVSFCLKTTNTQIVHWRIQGSAREAHLLLVQFLSFSCSFRKKSCQIIVFVTNQAPPPRLGNPGPTVDKCVYPVLTSVRSRISQTGAPTYYLAISFLENCMKMKEIGLGGGGGSLHWIRRCKRHAWVYHHCLVSPEVAT